MAEAMTEEKGSWPTYLAVAGATAGIAGGLLLGGLRVANSEAPQLRAEWAGNVVFALVYVTPFALSLLALRAPRPLWRAAVWAAAAVLGARGAFTAFSGASLVMLPGAILLAPAALAAFFRAGPRRWPAAVAIAAALVVLVVGAFLVLITGPDDGRCWELVRQADGETTWQTAPYTQGGRVDATTQGEEPGVVRVLCSSDVITTAEAGISFLLLAAAALPVAWFSRRRSPRPSPTSS